MLSSTDAKRRSYPYRKKYFEANPGLLGFIYFCGYCGKPLFGKKHVEVDHIVPLKRGGLNHKLNLVAACKPCNRSKSSKISSEYVVKGYTDKILQSIPTLIQKIIVKFIKTIFGVLVIPLKNKDLKVKAFASLVYIGIIYLIFFK